MKKLFFMFVAISVMFVATDLFSHNKTVKGRVLSQNGKNEPVVGATVRISNSVLGSITDRNGRFTIKGVPDGVHEVVISAVGMKPIIYKIELVHVDGDEIELDFEMIEDPVRTKSIVVTATRSDRIYEDVPVKVSVLSDRVFEATSSISVREGLNFQPGLRTEVNCQNCGFSQVRMNGLEGMYSQILIDGRPVFSALNSVYGLDQIPVNMIDRIEVVRGGGSALYGGSAIAGVVNIITKQPSANQFSIDYTQNFIDGSSPEHSLGVTGSIINEKQDLGLNIFALSNFRKEWDANNDGFSDIARLNVNSFGARGFYKLSFNSILQAEFHTIVHETRGGNKFHLPPHQADIAEEISHNTISGQLSYEQYLNHGMDKISLYSSFQITDRKSYYGVEQDPDAYGITDNETWASGVQYNKIFDDLWGYHIVTGGYEFTSDFVNDIALGYGRKIRQSAVNHGFYLQDDWNMTEYLSVVFGTRLDKSNFLDNVVVSPRANLLVKPIENLSLRTNISTGFRAPQAFDEDLHISVAGGERIVIKQDDNLNPEYSLSYGIAADYSTIILGLPIAFSAEYFHTKLNGVFILEDGGEDDFGNSILLKQNGDGAKVYGSTLELEVRLTTKFNFRSGVTLQKSMFDSPVQWSAGEAEDGSEAQYSDKMFRTPDFYGYFIADYTISNSVEFNLSGVYTGAMYLPHFAGYIEKDELKKSKPFFDLNAKISYKLPIASNLELNLGAKNIFNQFQNDLDKGVNRDAGYIYGPSRPFTIFMGIKKSI